MLYFFSDKIVLHIAHARPLQEQDLPHYYEILEHLSQKAGVATPRLYLCPDPQPNAFSVGRDPNHASIAVTRGFVESIEPEEVEGVFAHELAHIVHSETLGGSITTVLAGIFTYFAQNGHFSITANTEDKTMGNNISALFFLFLSPIASAIIRFVKNDKAEIMADFQGATLTRNPQALVQALETMQSAVDHGIGLILPNPSIAHLFIVHPFQTETLRKLFDSQISFDIRLDKLRNMIV